MTADQTYTQLGLTSDPSAPRAKQVEKRKRAQARADNYKGGSADKRRWRHFEEEDTIAAQNEAEKANKIARPVSEQEGSVVANLIAAYGVNLKRMVLDHQLNPFQLNERQLQRQIVNYLRWEKAAFPEEFAEAEAKGWFSVEMYADPKLRSSQYFLASAADEAERAKTNTAAGEAGSEGAEAPKKGRGPALRSASSAKKKK
ncbi:hypothetical protein STCU_01407 [Strigomonas culicis]|nr:hypothetical protein STCU_01407 [Strigomonas culicis]|eukprot:EPY34695.1 hypothetical protein STCU_01407 [Strigomonas culicis]